NSGFPQRDAVRPGDLEGLKQRARDVATRTGKLAGEICFYDPIATGHCFRIETTSEEQRQRILDRISHLPRRGAPWSKVVRAADIFFDLSTLSRAEAPAPGLLPTTLE